MCQRAALGGNSSSSTWLHTFTHPGSVKSDLGNEKRRSRSLGNPWSVRSVFLTTRRHTSPPALCVDGTRAAFIGLQRSDPLLHTSAPGYRSFIHLRFDLVNLACVINDVTELSLASSPDFTQSALYVQEVKKSQVMKVR